MKKVNVMKGNFKILIKKDMVHTDSKMEIDLLEVLREISLMESVNIFGQMGIITKESFPMGSGMEREQ